MISVTNLCKSFDDFKAVDNLSFDIKPGDILGFLGPNGAGKSTTMKMLTGFLRPTSGEIRIADLSLEQSLKQIQQKIGYLPEGAPAYGDMTPIQFLDFIADVRGLSKAGKGKRIQQVAEQLELHQVLDKSIDNLSKGFKRRVGLAQAILHDPDILILDEPTDGLDPNQKHQVRELIKGLSRDKIVIISTHILEEVSAVCNRAMIIANGKMLFDSTPQALQQRSKYYHALTLTFDSWPDVQQLQQLEGVDDMEALPEQGQVTLFPKQGVKLLDTVTDFIHQQQWQLESIVLEQGRLDQIFRDITAGDQSHG